MTDPEWDYEREPKVPVEVCPLCRRKARHSQSGLDRYGYPVAVVSCRCGLRYLTPQLTRAGYERFYNGVYRRLTWSKNHGPIPFDQATADLVLLESQRRYAEALARLIAPWRLQAPARVLDVGGSTGHVAHILWPSDVQITTLDPSTHELTLAAPAVTRLCGYVEDGVPEGPYDGLLLLETLEHLPRPVESLSGLRHAVTPGGWLLLDAILSTHQIKIDHPTIWSPPALTRLLRVTDWVIRRHSLVSFRTRTRVFVLATPGPGQTPRRRYESDNGS